MTPEGTLKAAQRTFHKQADKMIYDGANEDLDTFSTHVVDAIERATENKAATTGADDQQGGIKYTEYSKTDIEQNKKYIADMSPVYQVPKAKLQKSGKKPSELFNEFFDSIGNTIYSEEFGEIALRPASTKSEIRHGITAEKLASIEAIPSVIQQGRVIAYSHKGAGVHRIVVCAPINIGKQPYYMGVMLQRDAQNQRLYLHNVVIQEETTASTQVDLLTTGTHEENDSLYITSILRNALAVKQQYVQQGGEVVHNPMTREELTDALVRDPDDIQPSGKSTAYTYTENGRNKLADTVLYEKNVGEKSYYVVQAVANTKKKILYIVTAFSQNNAKLKGVQQFTDAQGPSANAQDAAVDTPTDTIAQSESVVNVEVPLTREELTDALVRDIAGDNSPYITADEIRGILEGQ